MFNNSMLRLKTEQRGKEESNKLLCTLTSMKPKTVLREKRWEGRTEFEHQFEKLAKQDFGHVAESTKRAKRHVSPAAKLDESQHELLRFLQMNPKWLKWQSTLRVALTITEQSLEKQEDSSLRSFYSYDAQRTKINLWLFGYSHFPN